VLDRLTDVGLVNDAMFARDWVASRQRRRHLSRSALKRELGVKGVSPEDVDAALESVDADAEFASALDLAQRKQRQMSGLAPEVRYRRLAGVLSRRGFGSETTSRVLAEVLGED
jgi:regulatory protein